MRPSNPRLNFKPTRKLTLNETFDKYGRLIQMLGTTVLQPGGTYGQPLLNTPTETPQAGTTEIWEIYNLTGDTHPIHFHLVNVQVLSRQAFCRQVWPIYQDGDADGRRTRMKGAGRKRSE